MKMENLNSMEMYMNLRRYNPFPLATWVLMFLSLVLGFFLGSFVQSKAMNEDHNKTCDYINHRLNR